MRRLGVILYQMMVGKLPSHPRTSAALGSTCGLEKATASAVANLRANVPEELKELILSLLKPEPAHRPSASELAANLERLCRECNPCHKSLTEVPFHPGTSYLDHYSTNEDESQPTVLIHDSTRHKQFGA